MLRLSPRILVLSASVLFSVLSASAQDTTHPTSVDPDLLALETARVPKEYTIRSIKITGINYLDSSIVQSISGLQPGDKVMIPGGDQFSKAITSLWRQKLFSNINIYIIALQDNQIDLEINVQERPRLGNFSFQGIKKSEADELKGKAGLVKSTIITENTRRNAVEAIQKFYVEKGFKNVQIRLDEKPDPSVANTNSLTFYITKGKKVHVNELNFYGNEQVTDFKLKKQMKGTKEMTKITLHPVETSSSFGTNDKYSFDQYLKDWGFLSFSKTRIFLDPYFRFKLFSSAKYDEKKYLEDKEKVLSYYNSLGYRDAQIEDEKQTPTADGNLNIDLKISEGRKYYFGDVAWKGNTKYPDSLLNNILGIHKGDVYNLDVLNKRLGKQMSQEGNDISGLYMDDGYLFFRADPVETSVYNDTIDHEIRIVEGPQATIKNVGIFGNEKTKDHVIRRELRTVPGEKFSRSDLIRSQRELSQLQYFNQEKINPGVNPNQEDGTVDINWNLEEKSSDQLELSAGWGGGIGLTGTLGVTFNNFSVKNILNKESWDPLPTGDGQKLSLRVQSNGRAYRSYNFSFTEPWLGGKKRNSFTVNFYNSKYSNAYDYATGTLLKSKADSSYLRALGGGISLGKQLKWPDDYFSLVYSLQYTQYKLKNYPGFFNTDAGNPISNGTSTNVSLKLALQRSSVFDPTFPRSGSNFVASVQLTPPYSLLNPSLVTSDNPYKNPEFHKWRFNSEWYVPVGRAHGAEKNRQLVLKLAAKYGFMGRYNRNLNFSPFERFQVGGDGLTNSYGLFGYDIIALRGYPVFQNSDPTINPDLSQATRYFTIFNKYSMELRYPLVTNPSSTIFGLTFFDAANGWFSFKDYNPFRLRRSAGVGMRFFLPMFGLLGFDYGVGLDRLQPGVGLKDASRFTFMLGFEPE
ncbi:POTRA domain-containing protein [Paraflavisolibacter sp. H34]|uniref:BamA/OMP85 family outer membrane protein n=1 Tax=Huijunlia imazamoxiresistens TaxID=3127457 RepID=UPI00301A93E4